MQVDHIMKLLVKATQHQPMPLADLIKQSGMDIATLQLQLDAMHTRVPALVNKVRWMKRGEWQDYYWPTGIVSSLSAADFVINPKTNVRVQKAPAREVNRAAIQQERNSEMSLQDELVELVKANPGITPLQVKDKLAGDDQLARKSAENCIQRAYRAAVLFKTADGSLTTVNPNTQQDGVATIQPESAGKPPAQQTSPEAQAAATSLDGGDQPDAEGTAIPAESTVQPLPLAIPEYIPDVHPDFGRFRAACTSDGTLILFGLTQEPLEISHQNTLVLLHFVGSQCLADALERATA